MDCLDRTHAPEIHPFGELHLPQPRTETLSRGAKLHIIDKGDQEVCRIDLLFEGGRYASRTPSIADLTGPMLRKGVAGMNADEIAELLDYHGAWLQTATTLHYSTLSLFSLNRNLDKVLPVVAAMIEAPTLPDDSFETLRQQRIQQILINQEKVRILAGDAFNSLIFGKKHPYARTASAEELRSLGTSDLRDYHNRHYLHTHTDIVLSGRITDEVEQCVKSRLGNLFSDPAREGFHPEALHPETGHSCWIDKPEALQSGIRMGMPTIDSRHPDYPLLCMLNLVLGEYFGSRLMTNIREEKGYTYGISSHIISLRQSAYFTVMTEAGSEYTLPLIEEVRKEMQRLCNEPIPADELETARNYLQGRRARILDSPFSISDHYVSTLIADTPTDYFDREDEAIRGATAADLQRVAQTYLSPDQLYTAIAGDKHAIEG